MKFNKKYLMLIFAGVLLTASIVFFVYTIKANSNDNEIGIGYAELTDIKTGTESFTDDGLDYSDSSNYHATTGYTAGNDKNESNAIVRSFDKVTYSFDLGIKKKDEIGNTTSLTAYSNRTVLITATVSEEASKYVVFEENGKPGQTSYTYEIKNVDEINGSRINTSISIYVLGAPNGTLIDPKFEITESTNTDDEYVVTLGKLENKHNYLYDATKETAYSTVANFKNYLPTVVSSTSDLDLNMSLVGVDTQKATYESKQGRYMNYVLAIYATGSLKGKTMPTGDIVLNGTFNQDGSESIILKPEFVRLYSESQTGDIQPVVANKPYSNTTMINSSKYTRIPGTIVASNINNNSFVMTISDLGMSYLYPTANADNSAISSNENYLGTYAITLFSPRSSSDGVDDINVDLIINGANVELVSGNNASVNNVFASLVNSGYVETDYNLETGFYEMDGTKIKSENEYVYGGKSRGAELQYITTFNYSTTGSKEGLKEIIKIDPNAFRFMEYSPSKDFEIKVYCGNKECTGISEEDFEFAFVGGDFNASNYTATNYDTVSEKINSDEASIIQNACTIVKDNLDSYNSDQIMNLYGGPCISENSPKTYGSISSAVTNDNEEIRLSKLIVQTKKGVNLPDNVKVVIKTKLRVRNVLDISQKYQATTIATSSDYDNKITYFAPRVTNTDNASYVVTNPNNFRKTTTTNGAYGDALRILNFESKSKIIVTNKTKDGRMKTNFNAVDNETIHFKVSTTTSDYNVNVGADDSWYFNVAQVLVIIPEELTYIPNSAYMEPAITTYSYSSSNGIKHGIQLTYNIPLTKPNQAIPDIYFDAILSSDLTGNGNEIIVKVQPTFINVNGESFDSETCRDTLKIYGNGINNMVLSIANDDGTKIEKNTAFSYTINGYNNTDSVIDNYEILNVLPSNTDGRGSTFSGTYKVRLDAASLNGATVTCTTYDLNNITPQMEETETIYTECPDIFSADGVSATAFKISNISAQGFSNITPIKVYIIPEGNKYSDIYKVSVTGGSETYMPTNSNELTYEVISRKISGKVFIDVDEDGVQKGDDKTLANIPVSLYKIIDDNNVELVKETTTLESGVYTFDNLDKGFYKIRFNYDSSLYDLSLRYAIEDTNIDSDAYKLDEGLAEISNKHDPYSHEGIDLVSNTEVKHMDMGLINRKPFAMSIKKYITKIDLSYNGITDTKNYNNESKVLISVRNSLKATAKVYYGFEITNNSQVAGYVSNIYEDIPDGLLFDSNDPYNEGWVYVNGKLQNTTYQSQKLLPGESIYTQVALNMPAREEAGSFLNKVSLEIKSAEEKNIKESIINNDSEYAIGELINYENKNWNVIGVTDRGNEQLLTLLLNDESTTEYHTSIRGPYKWSSIAHFGITLANQSKFEDQVVCDDASALVNGSHGGELKSSGQCTSGQYHTTKMRFLTEEEYNAILNMNLTDVSWLIGSHDYFLQTAVNIPIEYNEYGQIVTDFSNYVKYVDVGTSSIGYVDATGPNNKRVRPVITVNSKYIVNY